MYLATQKKLITARERKRWGIERIVNLYGVLNQLLTGMDVLVLSKEEQQTLKDVRTLQDFMEPREGINVTSYIVFRDEASKELYMMVHSKIYGWGLSHRLN